MQDDYSTTTKIYTAGVGWSPCVPSPHALFLHFFLGPTILDLNSGGFKTNFQVEHERVYCSEDEHLCQLRQTHFALEKNTSSLVFPFEITSHCYYLQSEPKVWNEDKKCLHGGKFLEYIESCLYM